jgi:hypothetical protein
MPKLPIISGMEAIKAFSKAGWIPHRQVIRVISVISVCFAVSDPRIKPQSTQRIEI